jgi:hypothetical protein
MGHPGEVATGWFSISRTDTIPAVFDEASIRLRLHYGVARSDDHRLRPQERNRKC